MTQQIGIRLHFRDAFVEGPAPIFLRGQGIQGSALIEGADNFQFDTVKLILEGKSRRTRVPRLLARRC
jgi:hypothetical protein